MSGSDTGNRRDTQTAATARYDRLREVADEYADALAERPTRCGSEQMMRDEYAGDSLELLLAIVEAAAVYRARQKGHKIGDYSRGDLTRARDELDAALEALS